MARNGEECTRQREQAVQRLWEEGVRSMAGGCEEYLHSGNSVVWLESRMQWRGMREARHGCREQITWGPVSQIRDVVPPFLKRFKAEKIPN